MTVVALLRVASRRAPSLLLALPLFVACVVAAVSAQPSHDDVIADVTKVLGTWAGDSICVGDRPACKNEHVVYRFVAVDGRPGFVRQLADKVIDGKRVPMGALEFEYNDADGTLTSEFTRGQTHGVWAYKVSGDTMTGTLVILPDKTLGRRVTVRRVREDQVPKAPALEEYIGFRAATAGGNAWHSWFF
jgi:hypothetical protein